MVSLNHALEIKVKTITEVVRILDVNNTAPLSRGLRRTDETDGLQKTHLKIDGPTVGALTGSLSSVKGSIP